MQLIHYEIIAVLVFVALDYITGVVKTILAGNLSSAKMREGLGHKFAYLCAFFVAWFIDFEMQYIDLGFIISLTPLITVGIVLIELSSVLENLCEINPEIKKFRLFSIFTDNNSNDIKVVDNDDSDAE